MYSSSELRKRTDPYFSLMRMRDVYYFSKFKISEALALLCSHITMHFCEFIQLIGDRNKLIFTSTCVCYLQQLIAKSVEINYILTRKHYFFNDEKDIF